MAHQTLLIGTGGDRLYACSLTSHGQLQLLREIKTGHGPSWLLAKDELLYVANEHSAHIQTFSIDDRQQGLLTLKETISSIGHTPCSFAIDATGKWLAVSNYGYQGTSNVVIFPLNDSKMPEEKNARVISIDGHGPHPSRQDHSYCHHVIFDHSFLYVVDLGTDTVSIYRFDGISGEVSLMGSRIKTEAGAGPRHMIFHPTKPLAFVCNELNSTVNVYRTHRSLGQLDLVQTIATRREEDENDATKKENYTAELQFTPNYDSLLVSNRGDDNLVIYNIRDGTDQVLELQQHLDCRGAFPRFFTFDPSGAFLLIANQNSNNMVSYAYDRQKNTYTFVSELNNIESGQHVVFL